MANLHDNCRRFSFYYTDNDHCNVLHNNYINDMEEKYDDNTNMRQQIAIGN